MPKPVVAFLVVALLSLPGAGQAPDARFTERAFVTAIDVISEVRDARGETPADLTPADFRLLENGVERKIISVEYLDPASRPAQGTPEAKRAEKAPRAEWQVVVWFDAMTMSRATLTRSARVLAERAPDLVRFGPVTLVHSDIAAEVLVDATRDSRALEAALETLVNRPASDRIAKIRREFLAAADNVTEVTIGASTLGQEIGTSNENVIKMGAVDRLVPSYVAEEERLLGIARTNLFRWLERIPRRMPRMLVYVGDGFDLDPASFYIDVLAASGDATVDVNQLRSEIKTKTSEASDELARRLAVGGWTALTIGGRNTNFSQDVTRGSLSGRQTGVPAPFLFMNPGAPLIQLAEETGGERIADAGALPGALDDIGRRVRITYQVSREPDPSARRIEIVPLRAGLTVRAPEWVSSTTTEGVAEARAIDMLSGGSARGDLGVTAVLHPAGESGVPSIEARLDFGGLAATAQQIGATKVRMTIAIELPGEPAVTFHRLVDVADLAAVPGIAWSVPIELPENAGSIAVVAEELMTGSWGGARIGDAAEPPAVTTTSAAPSSALFAVPPRLTHAEAFARAAAERKLVLAFEWEEKCKPCNSIFERGRANPEVARRMGAFVIVGPAPPPADARVALYDPAGDVFLSWPAIGYERPFDPLSPGDLTVILQRAAAAAPHLLRAHELFARGEEIDARLAVAFAYQDAGEAERAEKAYAEAGRLATAQGNTSKAQSARVLASLMASNQGRAEDALKDLRAIAASPATPLNEAEAHLVTAMILRAQNRDKEAAALLERVLVLAPKDSAAHQAALSLAGGPGVAALGAAEGGASRQLQLVVGGKPPYSGKTRLQVIVRDPAVSSVSFRADDAKAVSDASPPFEATLDLGGTPRRREIRAVAHDARGNVLAEDAIVLNERHDELWVRLRPVPGSDVIGIESNVPTGSRIARVEFFVDGKRVEPLSAEQPAIRLPASEDGVVVRAVATLDDGRSAEDATLAGGYGFSETIEARDVEIYASVLDPSGKPLSGLDRSQFSITEDGKKKRIAGFEFLGRAPIAVGIAVDSSSSMREAMPDVHRTARTFLELATRQGSSAFVVDFDTAPRLAVARTSNLPLLHAAVSRIRADGSTALYDAIIFGLLQLQGVPGKRALIVLTDGRDATSRYGLRDAIAVARESGVAIYAIILSPRSGPPVPGRMSTPPTGTAGGSGAPSPGAIYSMRRGTRGADPQIERIAVESGGRAWYLPESANMDAIYRAIDLELRSQYRLTYRTAPGRGATDWREVNVAVDVPGATVRTAAGFVAR